MGQALAAQAREVRLVESLYVPDWGADVLLRHAPRSLMFRCRVLLLVSRARAHVR